VGKALAAVERILLLFPGVSVELRDRPIYYQLGHWAAGNDFETYLAKAANAEDACDSPLAKPVG